MPSRIEPIQKTVEQQQYGVNHKLIGKDYTTPDLLAKVTGKSKYAEDFRADGMLFCKLLLSPHPHARVRNIDAREALAMPGVKGILTADDLPAPAPTVTDSGLVIPANKRGEHGLTNEPLYQGEPILAVAAESELAAAEAIEKIKIDFELLPFVIDPIETLRPGSPDPRTEGNVWYRPAPPPAPAGGRGGRGAPVPLSVKSHKWTDADFAAAKDGQLPMGEVLDDGQSHWTYGADVQEGFKKAALILDETFVTPDTSHQTLETRSAMAYWQNGKAYVFAGTQSTAQSVPVLARALGLLRPDGQPDVDRVVFTSEYTGGGFGSKAVVPVIAIIPALLSKKCQAPVMMRISREEEHFIGRARPSILGRVKLGFDKDGRILACDMFSISDAGAYDWVYDGPTVGKMASMLYQPESMRFRSITVMTNTPPRGAQSSPGGMQAMALMEPILSKAARKLGVDQVAIRRINAPEGKAKFGPAVRGKREYLTSCFIKEALDKGAEQFRWSERIARTPKRIGSKVRGVGVSMSCYTGGSTGYDGLLVIKTDGRVCFQSGIGNLGTESVFDVHRVAAEMIGVSWDQVDICFGSNSKNLPWSSISGGSQTTHAMTRAAHALGVETKKRLQEVAAKSLGGKPEDYDVANGRVFRKGGGAGLTLAQAAQKAIQLGGIYDGHEVNPDVNRMTKASVAALAGEGMVVSARDKYPHDGSTHSFVASFAEVEVDVDTGKYNVIDYLAVADVGTVLHPKALGGQVLGRSVLGMGHALGQKWVMDDHYGAMLSKRFHHSKPPTIMDVPHDMQWAAVDIPDPETPVGARGIGEPPVGGGFCSILNALSDALGDNVFQRAPVNADTILASLEAGRPMQHPLKAHI